MEKFCTNHPFSEAHWYCKKCQTSYCFPCVEKKGFKFSKEDTCVHVCPTCKRMVEWTGIHHISENVIVSSAKALFYPLSPFALIVVVTLYCVGMLFSENLYMNECLFAIIWSVIGSYSLTVLDQTVQGKITTPPFTAVHIHELVNHIITVFKQSMIYLGSAVLFFGAVQIDNMSLAYAVMVLAAFIFPLGIMRSMASGSYKSFFDLSSFVKIFKKTGAQYMVIMMLYMPVIAVFHLMTIIQPALAISLVCFLMISIYRLLGQMILKCHKELNYSLNYENFKDRYSLETLHGFKA